MNELNIKGISSLPKKNTMKQVLWIILVTYSNLVFAYNDAFLLNMSTELNKKLPQQKDKYTILEKTTYASGVFIYFYSHSHKRSDFTKEELAAFKNDHPIILQNRLCAFLETLYKRTPQMKEIMEGVTYQHITFDSLGKLLNSIETKQESCN